MDKFEMNGLLFELRQKKSNGEYSSFALFADGKMLDTDQAIDWLETKLEEKND